MVPNDCFKCSVETPNSLLGSDLCYMALQGMLMPQNFILFKIIIGIVSCHLFHNISALSLSYFFLYMCFLLIIVSLRTTIVLIIFYHQRRCTGEHVQDPGVEGDEDYEHMPQYGYDDAILDGQSEDA